MRGWWQRLVAGKRSESEPGQEHPALEQLEIQMGDRSAHDQEHLAVFAALLARVAFADDEVAEIEVSSMAQTVVRYAKLDSKDAEIVAAVARDRAVTLQGTDDHLLTRRFHEVASEEERTRLIECLYAVATADDLVTHVEDREIRRIADALLVPRKVVLEIRSRHREKLEEIRALRALRGSTPT